jgi:hypothetical protein
MYLEPGIPRRCGALITGPRVLETRGASPSVCGWGRAFSFSCCPQPFQDGEQFLCEYVLDSTIVSVLVVESKYHVGVNSDDCGDLAFQDSTDRTEPNAGRMPPP